METERKLLKIPLGFRSKIPRRGIYEYQRPENFAKHNALCKKDENYGCLLYTSPSPRDLSTSRMPSSA